MKHDIDTLNSTSELSVRDWLDTFGETDFSDWWEYQLCAAGWWDWFERSDKKRIALTKNAVKILRKIFNSEYINPDTMYVWFKQSLCGDGTLTESLKISDIKTGNVLYSIGYTRSYGWELWDFTEGAYYENTSWEHEVFEGGKLSDVYKFFLNGTPKRAKKDDTVNRFEVYDCNHEVMADFDDYADALDYYANNPCMFIYDVALGKVVEGSDE